MSGGSNMQKVREAMYRLLAGQSVQTDGRLTLKNLALEAGIHRQRLYDADMKEVVGEFSAEVQRLANDGGPPVEKHMATIAKLQEELEKVERRATTYREKCEEACAERDTLANYIVVLEELNRRLEAQVPPPEKIIRLPHREM